MPSNDMPLGPMILPRGTYLAARLAAAMLFAAMVSLPLVTVASLAADVALTLAASCTLLVLAVLGVVPLCVPMSFLCGLGVQLPLLHRALAALAPLWPSWHLAEIAHAVVGAGHVAGTPGHLLALAAVAVVCFAAARRASESARWGARGPFG